MKNYFQISYDGITFSADDDAPVTFSENGTERPVKLISYEEEEFSFTLEFEDKVKLIFALENEGQENSALTISAKMPENAQSINLNFSPNAGFSMTERKERSAIFADKTKEFSLKASALLDTAITLQSGEPFARYEHLVEQNRFSLDDIEEHEMASQSVYKENLAKLTNLIIHDFLNLSQHSANFATTVSEQTVISFLAAMTEAGRHNEAINAIPKNFTESARHTYHSTPFLGGMSTTLPTLTTQVANFNTQIAQAVRNRSLDIFTIENIASYMYTQGNRGNVASLVRMPASMTNFEPTISQASGIIRAHAYFREQNSSMAQPLEPVLDLCAKKIMEACSLEGEKIVLSENESRLSAVEMMAAADALISYGTEKEMSREQHFGYFIANSYLRDENDLHILAEIYPILIHTNKYYPHFELLRTLETGNIWAYTISPEIGFRRDGNITISFDVEFPVGLSHYAFISGIAPFRRIQIYNMDFRSDARFETYNSSGYIYRNDLKILLLKSRHREQHEIVRLYYGNAPERPATQAAPSPVQNAASES
ncbi:MAG: hypothetical protein K2N58_03505 [Treponemataceae bacterium]|nr:hypothetical protein [Treponemataceae bacterium]